MNDLFSYLDVNVKMVAAVLFAITVLWIAFDVLKYYRKLKNKKGGLE